MKPKFFNFILVICVFFLFSQNCVQAQLTNQNPDLIAAPNYLIGLGLGINDYGLGGGAEFPVTNKFSVIGNIGIGGWGWKLGGAFSFYPNNVLQKSSFSFGYSIALGAESIEQELQVEPNAQMEKVTIKYNKVGTINLVYSYNFKLWQKSKLVLSTGYAIPVTTNPYTIITQGVKLTPISEQILEIMEPGGLILGLKFMVGI